MAEIDVKGFDGANNVVGEEHFYSNAQRRIASPRVILNADIDLVGRLNARKGKTLFLTLAGAHSLWSCPSCMLCAAGNTFYRIKQGAKVTLGTISGPAGTPLSYAEAEGKVYASNPYWCGVYDPAANTLSSWGVSLPPGPMLLSGTGNLPAGVYHVCMTNVSGTDISGNGPIVKIELTATGGIQILNRPSGALVWATEANESVFYRVGAVSQIVDIPAVEPLPTFLCSPPPNLDNLCYAFGRMWGSSGSTVYYSEPFKLGLFRLNVNKFTFDSPITLIAKVSTGLYVGMESRTVFLAGVVPKDMQQIDAGSGSIPGTLVYCDNMPELGWTLGTESKNFTDVPVWLTDDGVVVGNATGKLFNITKNKLKTGIPVRGASLYRNLEGITQFLTSFKRGVTGSGMGFSDADTMAAFEDGRIDVHNERIEDMGGRVGFSDSATCTVTRGGVLI
jgi:hypothetical protein